MAASAFSDSEVKPSDGLSKILTRVLEEFETRAGFVLGQSGKADILVGAAGAEFNAQLRAGRPFKDVGAGKDHGEFTRRLQWYLAGSSGLLKQTPSALYKSVPAYVAKAKTGSEYLWVWLVDRNPPGRRVNGNPFDTANKWDWRSPENLTQSLTEDNAFPTLSAVLSRRRDKRGTQQAGAYIRSKDDGELRRQMLALLQGAKDQGKKSPGGMFYKR